MCMCVRVCFIRLYSFDLSTFDYFINFRPIFSGLGLSLADLSHEQSPRRSRADIHACCSAESVRSGAAGPHQGCPRRRGLWQRADRLRVVNFINVMVMFNLLFLFFSFLFFSFYFFFFFYCSLFHSLFVGFFCPEPVHLYD